MEKYFGYICAFLIALGMSAYGQTPTTEHGWLGVQIQEVTADLGDALGVKPPRGALVASLSDDGPAKAAGIQPGDVIVRFDGRDIPNAHALPSIVGATPVGKAVEVVVIRDGKEQRLNLTVAQMDAALLTTGSCSGPLKAFTGGLIGKLYRMDIEGSAIKAIQQTKDNNAGRNLDDGSVTNFNDRNMNEIIAEFLSQLTYIEPVDSNHYKDIAAVKPLEQEFIAALPSKATGGSPAVVQAITEQVFACFPYLARPFQQTVTELEQARQAQHDAEEQYNREQKEAERGAREEQEQLEAAAAKAREPQNILKTQYANYMVVSRCYAARQGYLSVYISEPEMARAKQAIARIEDLLKPSLPPGITTDALWSQANSWPVVGEMTPDQVGQVVQSPRAPVSQIQRLCQQPFAALLQTYSTLAPQDNAIKKDFP